MNDDEFEWDDAKAAQNYADHGVSFDAAKDVFKDPFAIERLDDREEYGEDRYSILGMVDGRIIYVVYRIISARGAEPHERRRYHEDNA
jgi:uncharacterized DUF497 family protein